MPWLTTSLFKRKRVFVAFSVLVILALSVSIGFSSEVGTSSIIEATSSNSQRKTFFASGRFWVFYSDGTNLLYKTSITGLDGNWTSSTTIRQSDDGRYNSIWFNNTHVSYVSTRLGSNTYFRCGVPENDGSITWSDDEQLVFTLGNLYDISLIVDSSGYPFISYKNSSNKPYVIKSQWNNGSWNTASGFPYELSSVTDANWKTILVPLMSNKVYAIYGKSASPIKGRLWNGTNFEDQQNVSSSNPSITQWGSAVNQSDNIHFVFSSTGLDLTYVKYNGTWGSEQILEENINSAPTLSINPSNGDLYVFEDRLDDKIWVRAYVNGSWLGALTWISDSVRFNSKSAFYQIWNNRLGVVWTTKSPYKIKFMELKRAKVISIDSDVFAYLSRPAKIEVELQSEFDGSSITTGTWYINAISLTHIGSGIWEASFTSASPVTLNFNMVTSDDERYSVNMNSQSDSTEWREDFIQTGSETSELEPPVTPKIVVSPKFQLSYIGLWIILGGIAIIGASALISKKRRRLKPRGVRITRSVKRRIPRKPRQSKRSGRFIH